MKQLFIMAIAAGALALFPIQALAQYPSGGVGGITEETLQRCGELNIPRAQCSEATVLQAERIVKAQESGEKGSGTAMLATETGQMIVFVGVLAAVFGGVAGAFFMMGRRAKVAA
jgi:hypothetical protein